MAIEDIELIRSIVCGEVADALKKRDEEEAAEMERICAGRTPGDFLRVAEPVKTLRDEFAIAIAPLMVKKLPAGIVAEELWRIVNSIMEKR
jgi:hypothetical protein